MRHGTRLISCLVWLTWVLNGSPAHSADPSFVYPNDSDQAESMLRSAAANVRDKQWLEASEFYQKVVQQFGDRAVKIPEELRSDSAFSEESRRWLNIREYVTALVALWPEEGRVAYRQRTDEQARIIWNRAIDPQNGTEQRKSELLRLADDFYQSSFGDRAMERLGDQAFQQGRFQEAVNWYSRLTIMPDEQPTPEGVLRFPAVYPSFYGEPALITAKYVLSKFASGQIEDSAKIQILKAFAEKYPNATGSFAGRSGLISASLVKAIADDKLNQAPKQTDNWLTFAGSPTRNWVVKDPIDIGARQWRVPIEPVLPPRGVIPRGGRFGGPFGGGLILRNQPTAGSRGQNDPILAYHPVIVGDQIAVATENRVVAYNLNEASKPDGTVNPLWWQDVDKAGNNRAGNQVFISGTPRMTLTAHKNRLFGRLGDSGISLEFGNRMSSSNAYIAAFDILNKGQVLWKVACSSIPLLQPDGNNAPAMGSLEGTPVADDNRVYTVITLPGHQTSTYVAALSADTGRVEWVQYLFDAPNRFDLQAATIGILAGHAHHLLTLANDQLYYQSDNGAVASLDAATGRIQWVTAYPRQELENTPVIRRDLNPAIYADGLVYVAPADSPHVFALEASSGAVRWKTSPLPDVVHLIGVAKGHLFATGDRVWTIDAQTGRIIRSWPDSGTGYAASGRGLLAGEYLYWPTQNEIHILDQKNGLRSNRGTIRIRERFQTTGGNLALGDGFLVVAGADSLNVFTQNSRLIRRYEQLIAEAPDAPSPRYRLATAAENIGETQLALNSYREALKRTKPTDRLDGVAMDQLIRDRLYRLLVKQSSSDTKPADALELLNEAVTVASDPLKRLAAKMLVASVRQEQGQTLESFREFVSVASDPAAHSGLWQVASHYEVNLAQQARRRLLEVWLKLSVADRKQVAEEELKSVSARLGKPLDDTMPQFMAGLTPGVAASQAWSAFAPRLDLAGSLKVLDTIKNTQGLDTSLQDSVKRHIDSQLSQVARAGKKIRVNPIHPTSLWQRDSKTEGLSLVVTDPAQNPGTAGMTPSSFALSMTESGSVHLIHSHDGSLGPELLKNAQQPIWSGLTQGRGLLFEGSTLTGFDPLSGRTAWRVSLQENLNETSENSPFVKSMTESANPDGNTADARSSNPEWWMIQSSPGKLLVQNLNGHIWRVDPVDGQVLWHRQSDLTGVASAFLVGNHVLMRDGSSSLVLDSESGAATHSMDRSIAGSDWCREPIIWDQNRVILATDRLHVTMLDLTKGEQIWSWNATEIQPHNGPPRFFRNDQVLMAIADGETAVRLDPNTGKVLWRVGLGVTDHSLERHDIALDSSRFYVIDPLEGNQVAGTMVRAFNLTDGSLAWQSNVIGSAVSWAITRQTDEALSGIWLYPDCELNRRLVTGQVLATEPADMGENQGNLSEGITPAVVQLDPDSGKIRRRIVNQSYDSGTWAVPDWESGLIYWGTNRNANLDQVQFQKVQGVEILK